jgi:hypothetical protein
MQDQYKALRRHWQEADQERLREGLPPIFGTTDERPRPRGNQPGPDPELDALFADLFTEIEAAAANDDVRAPLAEEPLELPAPANDDAPARPARVGRPENFRPRVSNERTRRTREATATCYERELEARGRSSVQHPTPSSSSLSSTNTNDNAPINDNKKSKRAKADERDQRGPADYKRATGAGKLTGMNRVIGLGDHGTPRTFTLNPGHDAIARARASNDNGFASWFQKRIKRELDLALGRSIPFVFGVDVTRSGRPHLHGMLACNDDELPAVERALRRAGGTWKAGHVEKQVKTDIVWNTDGWSNYSGRNLAAARKVVGSSVIAGTGALRSEAKALHERLRRLVMDAA